MASKLGPLFSLHAKGRKDWTTTLKTADSQVVVELNDRALVLDVLSEKFRTRLLETSESQWIYIAQILREDEEVLFAFADPRERTLFEELRGIDGIGPKSAALLVGRLGLEGFRSVIENPKNIATVKVPGLGPKNLEKISLGLKQKKEHFLGIVGHVQSSAGELGNEPAFESGRPDLERALVQLGVKGFEAREVFERMVNENSAFAEMALPQLLQEALKWWATRRARAEVST